MPLGGLTFRPNSFCPAPLVLHAARNHTPQAAKAAIATEACNDPHGYWTVACSARTDRNSTLRLRNDAAKEEADTTSGRLIFIQVVYLRVLPGA